MIFFSLCISEIKARIGDKDVDQVSELSERLSVASSIDFSSSSSTASENDLEHTEYSVTPLIRSSRSISRGSGKEMIQVLNSNVFSEGSPQFVKIPASKVTLEVGEMVTFEAITSGVKPIGKYVKSIKRCGCTDTQI